MTQALLPVRLMVRLMAARPGDTLRTIAAVTLGVAVISAVDLASEAAIGGAGARGALGAVRWHLRVMSGVTALVGVVLISGAVTAALRRRLAAIGAMRAMGASQRLVRTAMLVEGAACGVAGAAAGLAAGRLLAVGAVDLLQPTLDALQAGSAPAGIAFRPETAAVGLAAGVGASVLAAWRPAREAARAAPAGAGAPAQVDGPGAAARPRWIAAAGGLVLAALGCCLLPPAAGRIPVGGYLALAGLVGAAGCLARWTATVLPDAVGRAPWAPFDRLAGLAARIPAAAPGRAAGIVTALSTATALIVSLIVVVGSFRAAVTAWMDRQLRADYYVAPAGHDVNDTVRTMRAAAADTLAAQPAVAAVNRFRLYAIEHGGRAATLGLGDALAYGAHADVRFLAGPPPAAIWRQLVASDSVIVSELFAHHHDVQVDDTIHLPIGPAGTVELAVAGIFADYSNEGGFVFGDRTTLRRYLPDPRLTGIGVYLRPDHDRTAGRAALARAVAGRRVAVTANQAYRDRALAVFDRAFTIAWTLAAVAFAVAALGMTAALRTLVHDRRLALILLRRHGASRRQLRGLVLAQAGLLGLMAGGLGLGLGLAWSQVIRLVILPQSFGWSLPMHWPVPGLAAALGLTCLASIAAGLSPARAAARLPPTDRAGPT